MPVKHSLGWGNGRFIEYEDGTVGYIKSMEMSQAFRVPIADVTGFSVVSEGKLLERTLRVMGGGTVLASVSVAHGVSEKIEEWFRSHPSFRAHAPATASHVVMAGHGPASAAPAADGSILIADELRKLADLVGAGVLTQDEFSERKQVLLQRCV
ncbi:MAG: hypothetical protein QOI31_1892 [Solirubrobacterales bacterium]|jgi:hypothetical protein|nr:hypothetical protein [Solirubrobacterales bacterium]